MVLEHQTKMHSTLTRADFTYRKRVFERDIAAPANKLSDESSTQQLQSQQAELRLLAREVVNALLFHGEAELQNEVKASILFANEFIRRGKDESWG